MSSILTPAINGSYQETQGRFTLPAAFAAAGGSAEAWEVFAQRMKTVGDYTLVKAEDAGSAPAVLRLTADAGMETEAYKLAISGEGVLVTASGEMGQKLALATLFSCSRRETARRRAARSKTGRALRCAA